MYNTPHGGFTSGINVQFRSDERVFFVGSYVCKSFKNHQLMAYGI